MNATVSSELRQAFGSYEASLHLTAPGFGPLTVGDLAEYIVTTYLEPAAKSYIEGLPASARSTYLAQNPWIAWSQGNATFTWAAFIAHIGWRDQGAPAFDGFDVEHDENSLFGDETTAARHFTLYSLRHATGNPTAQLEPDLPAKVEMLNPMYFLAHRSGRRVRYWFLRTGANETETALSVITNLGVRLEDLGAEVNRGVFWEGGHDANFAPEAFVSWVGSITGYKAQAARVKRSR